MKKAMNVVPSHRELNAMLARTPAEEALFNRLDAELQWPQIPLGEIPDPGNTIKIRRHIRRNIQSVFFVRSVSHASFRSETVELCWKP